MHISSVNLCVVSWLCCSVDLYVFCLGVLMCNALFSGFWAWCVCLNICIVQRMEKRYRNKIIIIIILIQMYSGVQAVTVSCHMIWRLERGGKFVPELVASACVQSAMIVHQLDSRYGVYNICLTEVMFRMIS